MACEQPPPRTSDELGCVTHPADARALQPRIRWWRHLAEVPRLLRPRSLHRAVKLLPAILAPAGREVRIEVPGWRESITLRARTSDVMVAIQLLLMDELAFPELGEARLIIDAGANIGLSALTFAHKWPSATIICLEVDDANLDMLRRNTAGFPGIRVVAAGLWRRSAGLRISNPDAASWVFRVEEDEHGPIKGKGVAELLDEVGASRLDLLKVDIEGAETEVFGAEAGAWLDRVDNVMVELHEVFRPGSSTAIRDTLERSGFRLSRSGEYLVGTRIRQDRYL
jgi:FkbM family methyltransferase